MNTLLLRRSFLASALLAALTAAPAASQTLRGTLLEEESGSPVAGTLVTLRPQSGGSPIGTLTDSAGNFRLSAPAPGVYILKAERIGFVTTSLPPLHLTADDQPRELVLRVASAPVLLEGIGTVASRRTRCALRPEEGTEAAILWDEARKALTTAAWTDREGAFLFEHVLYENRLDPRSLQVTSSERRTERVRRTFQTLPVESLLSDGFVRHSGSATDYYGPDAAVLLSDLFLEQHCLRVAESDEQSRSLVGLAFEPVSRRRGSIRGTLWLERASAELRHLDFVYVNPPVRVPVDDVGGRVEFARLPSGEWIIQRWWIRTPHLGIEEARTVAGQPFSRTVLAGLNEHGGEVLGVYTRTGRPLYAALASTLRTVRSPTLLSVANAPPHPSPAGAEENATPEVENPMPPPVAARTGRINPTLISTTEILRSGGSDALEIVQSLRPQWLRSRGQTTLRTGSVSVRGEEFEAMVRVPLVVYVDGNRVGGADALRGISSSQLREIRYLQPREAVQRWGTDHGNGAVMVMLRR